MDDHTTLRNCISYVQRFVTVLICWVTMKVILNISVYWNTNWQQRKYKWLIVMTASRRALLSHCQRVSRHNDKGNFIHASTKVTAFPASIFLILTNGRRHSPQTSGTEWHAGWTTNVESRYREIHWRSWLQYGLHAVDFHETCNNSVHY
jgi:hypothetical protein